MQPLDAFHDLVKKGVVPVNEFRAVKLLISTEFLLLHERYLELLAMQAIEPDESIRRFGNFYQNLAEEKRSICTILDAELCEAVEAEDPDDVAAQTLVRRVLENRQYFLDIGLGIAQRKMDDEEDTPDTASLLAQMESIVKKARAAGAEPHEGAIDFMRILRETSVREQSDQVLPPDEKREQFERGKVAIIRMMKWMHDLSGKGDNSVQNESE